ncbi:MAG TPA: hypothetical protein DEB39_00650 [Planctomycetaceae bacterium]|nr:hypothetical protein [Planctomycetaceae bacterium]
MFTPLRTLTMFLASCALDEGRGPGPLLRFLLRRDAVSRRFYAEAKAMEPRLRRDAARTGTPFLCQIGRREIDAVSARQVSRGTEILVGSVGSGLAVLLLLILFAHLSFQGTPANGSLNAAVAAEVSSSFGRFGPDLHPDLRDMLQNPLDDGIR